MISHEPRTLMSCEPPSSSTPMTVTAAVMHPIAREDDPRPGRERFYEHGGPFGWVRVVTEFACDHDCVVTAFPQVGPSGSKP